MPLLWFIKENPLPPTLVSSPPNAARWLKSVFVSLFWNPLCVASKTLSSSYSCSCIKLPRRSPELSGGVKLPQGGVCPRVCASVCVSAVPGHLSSLKPSLPLSGSGSCPHSDTHTPRNHIIVGKAWLGGAVSQTGRRKHSIIITQCHKRMQNSFHIPSYTIGSENSTFPPKREVKSAVCGGCVFATKGLLLIVGTAV